MDSSSLKAVSKMDAHSEPKEAKGKERGLIPAPSSTEPSRRFHLSHRHGRQSSRASSITLASVDADHDVPVRSGCFNIGSRLSTLFGRTPSQATVRRVRSPAPIELNTTSAQDAELKELKSRIQGGGGTGEDVRVLQLKYDTIVANVITQPRSTAGLFKAACSTDLLFLIDTTGSMGPYIEAAKRQVRDIVRDIKEAFFDEADVRIAVVGYKDHNDTDKIQFLDFTPSADTVSTFLDKLTAFGGGDAPEDVLGAIQKALNASWLMQTRCIIHIADAPPHGNALNTVVASLDKFPTPGSEPHRLTHTPLLQRMIGLGINYCLLHINASTDKMALEFLKAYAPAGPDCKLLSGNTYHTQALQFCKNVRPVQRARGRALQFEEQQLGTTYSELRHLVVQSVTTSASRTASRLSGSTARGSFDSGDMKFEPKFPTSSFTKESRRPLLSRLGRSEAPGAITEVVEEEEEAEAPEVKLDPSAPQWQKPSFFDKTLTVEAYSTDVDPSVSLDDLMASDDPITISATELTFCKHSRPFAQGASRIALYARTSHSTSPLVVKSFKPHPGRSTKNLAHLADDMRMQVLCKAFAIEFNAIVSPAVPLDFVVATCLKPAGSGTSNSAADVPCMSLEPYLEGTYTKYNSNSGWVNTSNLLGESFVNNAAQAFSHYTFERSAGKLLVSDLQGVNGTYGTLTDPAIHTADPERFKLADTNLGEAGMKFFFATHKCTIYCTLLGLETDFGKMMKPDYGFRRDWKDLYPMKGIQTTFCSNKVCRKILKKDESKTAAGFEGQWCGQCHAQLVDRMADVKARCEGGGEGKCDFWVSGFYYEALGRAVPKLCTEHGG